MFKMLRKKTGKGCTHFWNAIRKYGKDAFTHEVLEVCTDFRRFDGGKINVVCLLCSRERDKLC